MKNQSATLTYRRAVTEQASPIGLVIALYDTLASDLQRAGAAMRRAQKHPRDLGAIQDRSDNLKHSLQVLGQLNALLDLANGGICAQNLARFYEHLRRQILMAQFEKDPEILDGEVRRILQVRTSWQQVDSRATNVGLDAEPTGSVPENNQGTALSRQPFSCSA